MPIELDLDEAIYHRHASLSATGAKMLLESPARFHYQQTHPRPPKDEFDLGSAVHSKVLGTGYGIDVIPDELLASNGAASTTKAKQFIEEVRAKGRIPIKADTAALVNGIAESLLAHPTARQLFEQEGHPEASVFTTDPDTGIALRCRFDYLAPICVDLKTTGTLASPNKFSKNAADFGYDLAHGHYQYTYKTETGEDREILYVAVETEPPYLVAVYQLDREFADMGAVKARHARHLYAECTASGVWPGYPEEVSLLTPPVYSVYDFQDRFPNG